MGIFSLFLQYFPNSIGKITFQGSSYKPNFPTSLLLNSRVQWPAPSRWRAGTVLTRAGVKPNFKYGDTQAASYHISWIFRGLRRFPVLLSCHENHVSRISLGQLWSL